MLPREKQHRSGKTGLFAEMTLDFPVTGDVDQPYTHIDIGLRHKEGTGLDIATR